MKAYKCVVCGRTFSLSEQLTEEDIKNIELVFEDRGEVCEECYS